MMHTNKFFRPITCPLNSPDLNPLDYHVQTELETASIQKIERTVLVPGVTGIKN
jgi:hypothetical protein